MIVSKDRICEFLYGVKQATALSVAKNVGFFKAKHVHITLYQLEKQGDICRQGITPPMWALTEKKRTRMQRKKGVTGEGDAGPPTDCLPAEDEDCIPTDDDMHSAGDARFGAADIPDLCESGKTLSSGVDDDMDAVCVPDQGLTTSGGGAELLGLDDESGSNLSRISMLRQCAEHNPVSGLMRYSQYMSQKCEFVLLKQSGPSHDPTFEMQAVLDWRRFPPCVGSNKKNAKKEAASVALKTLLREALGEDESEPEQEAEQMDPEDEEAPEAPPSPPPEPEAAPALAKNPISTLMEYTQRTGVPCEFSIVPHKIVINYPKFTFVVRLGDRTFPPVSASNKKLAKQLAAEAAVKLLEQESGPLLPPVPEKKPKST